VILGHEKNGSYETLTPPLGIEMRSKKINENYIIIDGKIDGESENYNRFAPGELLFFTKCGY
jgi:hypothetical protein